MQDMFFDAHAFNQDISFWDTTNVTNLDGMFYEATSFDKDLSSWDTSSVTNMFCMFENQMRSTRFLEHL